MSELIFVRHGQASFGADSYDKLSDLGIEQVKVLASHWQSLGEKFDHIYSGSLLRQRETANELLALVEGKPSQSAENTSLNEYNADPLIRIYLRDYADRDGYSLDWPIRDPKLFQQIFEKATARWIANELHATDEDTGFEAWQDFQRRVYSAVDEIMITHHSGSRVLISTSGGVIAMALQRVLQFPDEHVISTNWMVHNSSVSRIRYGNGRMSLTQFNNLAHLEKEDLQHMVTFR